MSQQEIKISVADPTALGVLGLSMVTLVASSVKLGWTQGNSLIIPWAIFLGAFAQIIASNLDFKKGNYFGATVLGAYGLFWFAVAMSWGILGGMFGESIRAVGTIDPAQLGFAFFGYLIFSLFVTVTAFETNVPFMIILVLIDILLGSLTLSSWGIGDKVLLGKVAGWSEFSIAITGLYATGALFFKSFYGREILPLGKPLGLIKKAGPNIVNTPAKQEAA